MVSLSREDSTPPRDAYVRRRLLFGQPTSSCPWRKRWRSSLAGRVSALRVRVLTVPSGMFMSGRRSRCARRREPGAHGTALGPVGRAGAPDRCERLLGRVLGAARDRLIVGRRLRELRRCFMATENLATVG